MTSAEPAAQSLIAPPVRPETGLLDVRRRVGYMMLFRLALISLVLGATFLLGWLSDVDLASGSSLILLGIVVATYALTIAYALLIDRVNDLLRFADIQLAVDLVITTLLVFVTGGAQSAYTFFYPLSIIGAATVRFRGGALVATALSIAVFATVSLLAWAGVLPLPGGMRVDPTSLTTIELARTLGLNAAAFAAVGFLAVNLGNQLQRTAASLEIERGAAADLFALHEDIVRSLSSGLITIDTRGRVLAINDAAREILHLDHDRPFAGDALADVCSELATAVAELGPREGIRRSEVDIDTAEAGRRALGVTISPLVDHVDRVTGKVVNFQDLTDLRTMELQVKRNERLAAIGTLAAGVAHELRNPLAAISGSVELLRAATPDGDGDGDADDESRALMGIVTREVGRLNSLITDLLDYANPRKHEPVDFDLAELTRETVRVFCRDPQFSGIAMEFDEDTEARELRIVGDPSKLRQVLWNLLRNAAEAAANGGKRVAITLSREAEMAILRVRDNGRGIPREDLQRIFDPFFTTKTRGAGLGLAIVNSIVDEHRGAIHIESDRGTGTTFTVRLPIGDLSSGNHPVIRPKQGDPESGL